MPLRKVYSEGKIGTLMMSPNIHKLVPIEDTPSEPKYQATSDVTKYS